MGELNKFTKESLLRSILVGGGKAKWEENQVNTYPELDSKGLYATERGLKFLDKLMAKEDISPKNLAYLTIFSPVMELGATANKIAEVNEQIGLDRETTFELIEELKSKGYLE